MYYSLSACHEKVRTGAVFEFFARKIKYTLIDGRQTRLNDCGHGWLSLLGTQCARETLVLFMQQVRTQSQSALYAR